MAKNVVGLHQQQELRQLQSLTPQQLTFFRLLEMNEARLEEEIKSRLEDNPALGIDPTEGAPVALADTDLTSNDNTAEKRQYADSIRFAELPWNNVATAEPTLQDHLKAQYSMSETAQERPDLNDIAVFIIDSIDADGYLRQSPETLADDFAVSSGVYVDITDIEATIDAIQELDPPGVAAYDLHESLLLQSRRIADNDLRSNVEAILTHGFDALVRHNYEELNASLAISRQQLAVAVEAIRRMNPRPGAGFATGSALSGESDEGISPDIEVEISQGNRVSISLPSRLPSLVVEESFDIDNRPQAGRRSGESDAWIRRRRDDARSFIEALGLRRKTLTDVMAAIVAHQRAWFTGPDAGAPRALKPMVLKDIATATGYDISTVSRAVQGKYASTPWGLTSLKAFFNEGVGGDADSEVLSQAAVADELRGLIEGEDPRRPLSDRQLTVLLQERGIDVARRTVAKYRDRLGIAPARERRKI